MENEIIKGLVEVKDGVSMVTDEVKSFGERLEAVETIVKRPAAVAKGADTNTNEYITKFVEYANNPQSEEKKAAYEAVSKAVTVAGLPDAKPRTVSNDVIAATRLVSPFANLVLRKDGISPDFSQTLSNGVGYELVGEETERSIQEANFSSKKPVFTEITTTIRMSKQAIEDLGFNLADNIAYEVAQVFGVGLERYLVNGTGTGVQNAGILLGGTAVEAAGPEVTAEDIGISSFIISLLFIGPVMTFFSISAGYAAAVAFILALSADYLVRKILVIVNELDLLQLIKDKFGGKK